MQLCHMLGVAVEVMGLRSASSIVPHPPGYPGDLGSSSDPAVEHQQYTNKLAVSSFEYFASVAQLHHPRY